MWKKVWEREEGMRSKWERSIHYNFEAREKHIIHDITIKLWHSWSEAITASWPPRRSLTCSKCQATLPRRCLGRLLAPISSRVVPITLICQPQTCTLVIQSAVDPSTWLKLWVSQRPSIRQKSVIPAAKESSELGQETQGRENITSPSRVWMHRGLKLEAAHTNPLRTPGSWLISSSLGSPPHFYLPTLSYQEMTWRIWDFSENTSLKEYVSLNKWEIHKPITPVRFF